LYSPVVVGSRAWYDVLGTARVLVTNTEPEGWYRRRPDQLVVQCFHGYPSNHYSSRIRSLEELAASLNTPITG